jgi:hypothetical protein
LDNNDVAILTKLNDLAERRGLKPYDFVAETRWDESRQNYTLAFEVPAQGSALREERYGKMLTDLGITSDSSSLSGPTETIIDALDHALSRTPKPRPRP